MMTNLRGDTVNLCYMDGVFRPLNETKLPVSDLIIQRGVGVFESIPTVDGRPLCMTAHIERLLVSANASTIDLPVAPDEMKSIIREGLARLARMEPGRETLIRPYITGGDDFDELKGFLHPRFFILFENANRPPKELYEKGVLLWPLDMARRSPETKSVDYMTSYSLEARENGAFEVLYARHRGPLYRFIARGISPRATADECFQDTWSRVVAARERYRPDARFSTWLYQIAQRLMIDQYRRARPQVSMDDDDSPLHLPGDESEQPEHRLTAFEEQRRLQQALAQLPDEQRIVLQLRLEQELSLEAIGEITGVGRETVKSRLRYAMDKLRTRFGP